MMISHVQILYITLISAFLYTHNDYEENDDEEEKLTIAKM